MNGRHAGASAPATTTEVNSTDLAEAVLRAHRAIIDETRDLAASGPVDYARHRRAKDLCLLDLMRRGRLVGADPGHDARQALRMLRDSIIENQQALRLHLTATRQIASVIMNVIAEENSDRTYAAPARRGRNAG